MDWTEGHFDYLTKHLVIVQSNVPCGPVCTLSIRGLLLEEKPELKRVLEQRRLEQDREKELALRPPSDLEQELRKRQLRLQEVRPKASYTHHPHPLYALGNILERY